MASDCTKCDGTGVLTRMIDGEWFAKSCDCIDKAILEKKIKFASIPKEFKGIRVSDFKTNLYTTTESISLAKDAREIVKNYMLNYDKLSELGKGLYLYSLTKGSGKTMLAIALGNALINMRGEVVKFATTIDVLAEIKATYDKQSQENESELINNLKKVKVLILDDIGTEKLTGWSNEIMYQIINDRMINKLVTIFTSNTHISQLKHDERIKSRIEKMAIPIQMPEESIRKQQADQENTQLIKDLLGIKE